MAARGHNDGPRYFCPECHLSIEVARTDELVCEELLALLDAKTWRRLRQGRPAVGTDDSGFEEAMTALTQRFVAGDIDAVQLGELAEALRRQHEVTAAPPPPLPDVANLRTAWPTLDLTQRRLVLSAATESLTIMPSKPSNRFDKSRVRWVPVSEPRIVTKK